MRSTLPVLLATALCSYPLCALAAIPYYQTTCFSNRIDEFIGTPYPVLAGMTSGYLTANDTSILYNDSFFDGGGDFFSALAGISVGTVDCGQNPDVFVAWGYSFRDSTAAEQGTLGITMTVYWRDFVGDTPSCDFFDNPTEASFEVSSGPDNARLFQVASSVIADLDVGPCVVGHGIQMRTRVQATLDYSPALEQSACFVLWQASGGSCPGAGDVCL